MGNSNLQDVSLKEGDLELSKYSTFYGKHQTKDGHAVKKYKLPQNQNDAFLGLIQSYRKIESSSLIKIEEVKFIKEQNCAFHYQLSFPFYSMTLADEIIEKKRSYSQLQIVKVINDVGQAIRIFDQKQFPFSHLSPSKIAVQQIESRYCIGIDILMNPQANSHDLKDDHQANYDVYLSPEQKQGGIYGIKIEHAKSQVYSLGLIALSCIEETPDQGTQQKVFDLRTTYSFKFCNLLTAMLKLENIDRISLEECLKSCQIIKQSHKQKGDPSSSIFIRGYNCVESMELFDDNMKGVGLNKWKLKKRQKI